MQEQKRKDDKVAPSAGCLLRLFWMMIGNVVLLSCAYAVAQHRSSLLSLADALYWAVVGSLLAARYVDIRYMHGTTAEGDPASLDDWRRYAAFLALLATGLWLVVHAMASFNA